MRCLLEINPIALQLGPVSVRWYGLMYLIGFYMTYYLGLKKLQSTSCTYIISIEKKEFEDLLFYCMGGAILGGRLGYALLYNFPYYFQEPIKIFFLWEGGMSFHGGIIGVTITIFVYSYLKKKSFFKISDFFSPIVPPALGAGRLGNFFNGELWGRPTDIPWGMKFPNSGDLLMRHPSQLYEFALEGCLLFILMNWFSRKFHSKGISTGIFLTFYGLLRFLVEFFREPDYFLVSFPFGLNLGQWLSIPMIGLGLVIIICMIFKSFRR